MVVRPCWLCPVSSSGLTSLPLGCNIVHCDTSEELLTRDLQEIRGSASECACACVCLSLFLSFALVPSGYERPPVAERCVCVPLTVTRSVALSYQCT